MIPAFKIRISSYPNFFMHILTNFLSWLSINNSNLLALTLYCDIALDYQYLRAIFSALYSYLNAIFRQIGKIIKSITYLSLYSFLAARTKFIPRLEYFSESYLPIPDDAPVINITDCARKEERFSFNSSVY